MSDKKNTAGTKQVIAKDSAALLVSTKPPAAAIKPTQKPIVKGK